MTEYIILKQDTGGTWRQAEGGYWSASSARRAIAAAGVDEGTYVAIPARSWEPLTVKVTQTTKVTIS